MSIKQFLKLDWRKIVIVLVILSFSFIFGLKEEILGSIMCYNNINFNPVLFPLNLIRNWRCCPAGGTYSKLDCLFLYCQPLEVCKFDIILVIIFLIHLIYWYIISCLIVWIYDKFRKRK